MTASEVTVNCVISTVTPNNGINVLGGATLTLAGAKLPKNTEDNSISLKFTDTRQTACSVVSTQAEGIVCQTAAFQKGVDIGTNVNLNILINGVQVQNSPQISIGPSYTSAVAITPSSVSPVLKLTLTI